MNYFAFRKAALIIFLSSVMVNAFAADSFSEKLAQLITKIKNIRQEIVHHQSESVDIQKQLHQTENSISSLANQLANTNSVLAQQQQALVQMIADQQKIEIHIKRQQQHLLQLIKARYLLGLDRNETQLILGGQDVQKIERLLTYSRYLTQQTHTVTKQLEQDRAQVEINKQTILTLRDKTKVLQKQQLQQQQSLYSHKQKQVTLLTTLHNQVKTKSQALEELLKNKQNLEHTIQNLEKKKSYDSEFLTHHKGKFAWPTQGKIIEHFGSNIAQSELRQTGIIIGAPEGQKVYAVAPGKVIFAHWMPGYGLLMIIDHGKGYMTLYGNNAALYKKTNQIVTGHELIAKVGHTGSQRQSSLYFALRYKGKPIDPATWCG